MQSSELIGTAPFMDWHESHMPFTMLFRTQRVMVQNCCANSYADSFGSSGLIDSAPFMDVKVSDMSVTALLKALVLRLRAKPCAPAFRAMSHMTLSQEFDAKACLQFTSC